LQSEEQINVKQVFNISSGANNSTAQQLLLIRIGERHFSYAVTDTENKALQQLTWYSTDDANDLELQEIFLKHPELRESYHKIIIGFDHPTSVLIPYAAYKQIGAKPVLESMFGVNGTNAIINEPVPAWQLYNVYAIPAHVQDWVSRHYPAALRQHNYSIGIKQLNTSDYDGNAMLDLRLNDFTLILNKANKLLLAQTFPYASPADVLYYLLKSCKEFSLAQEAVRLDISGLIEKESNLYRELVHYFLHVQFREPAWSIPAAEDQEYPAHFFTSLNDLVLCES
jgi:hypothetical protein